ncbi:MAG: hypothetical protein CMJ84_02585 [Planctomycetes bacterium]|nr:hypothetical protein [Planctomycetota bacterium]
MFLRVFLPCVLFSVLPAAAQAPVLTIAEESFDYPDGTPLGGLSGGVGWANSWWSGTTADDALVSVPGMDGVGGLAADNHADQGSYRFPANAGFEHMTENQLFGADGHTLWIAFHCRRAPGSADDYGGVSLYEQFVSERLFLGSPNSLYEWGIHDDPWNNPNPETVPGSSVDQDTLLVYRIDFQPGMERLRLWLDPADPNPIGAADLDTQIADLRFNELGFKSGNTLSTHGYWFDGFRLETFGEGLGDAYCFGDGSSLGCPCGNDDASGEGGCLNGSGAGAALSAIGSDSVAVDSATLLGRDLIPGQPGLYFQGDNAVNGGGGAIFGDGLRCAGGNVVRLQVAVADAAGHSQTSVPLAAAGGLAGGETRRYQLWYRDPASSPCGSTFNLTNGLELVWRP